MDAECAARLAEAIASRGLRGDRAVALRKLIADPGDDIETAIDAHLAAFPTLFAEPTPAPRMRRGLGPTTPPVHSGALARRPAGFVSREEYVATDHTTRMTPEFRKRVEVSKPYWPKAVSVSELPRED